MSVSADPAILVAFAATPVVVPVAAEPEIVWVTCWRCCGQGREYGQGDLGGWYFRTCTACCGVGSLVSVP